jgi:uncharacterized DUF497 family protein
MKFEWDPAKSDANLRKHGIPFETAVTAFDDPHAWVAPDPGHSTAAEAREWLIGEADTGTVLVVVYTMRRQGAVCRIISARPASRRERRRYEGLKGFPLP